MSKGAHEGLLKILSKEGLILTLKSQNVHKVAPHLNKITGVGILANQVPWLYRSYSLPAAHLHLLQLYIIVCVLG